MLPSTEVPAPMNWDQTRRRLKSVRTVRDPEANGDRRPEGSGSLSTPRLLDEADERGEGGGLTRKRALALCVCSGKGGTGKSIVTAALARLFSARGRTLVLDADLGVGNAHILQDVSPEFTLVDVVEGRMPVRDVLTLCSDSIDLVAAGSGVPRMADLSTYEMHLIAHGVHVLEGDYDYMLVDSAAGVSQQNLSFAEASDLSLVVTTPDLTAMTDAYALLKVLYARNPEAQMLLVVNRCEDEDEAANVERRIADVCGRFLGRVPRFVGWIPSDPVVARAVNHRCSVVSEEPDCPAARAFRILAVRVLEELKSHHPQGLGRMLLDHNGYSEDAI